MIVRFKKTVVATVLVGILSVPTVAHAVATLRVSANAGVNWFKIRDGDGDGVVTFDGGIGNIWSLSVAAGTTKPAIGSATDAIMNLSGATVSSSGAGTLLLEFSETFYGPLPTGNSFTTSLNSQNPAGGRTTVWSYLSTANIAFDESSLLGVTVQTGANSTSSVSSGALPGYAQFSLTVRIAIRHSGAGVSSFDAGLVDPPPNTDGTDVPDGGSTVSFLGFALLALAGLATWMKRARHV